jgi:hypothetical protein
MREKTFNFQVIETSDCKYAFKVSVSAAMRTGFCCQCKRNKESGNKYGFPKKFYLQFSKLVIEVNEIETLDWRNISALMPALISNSELILTHLISYDNKQ